MPKVDVRYQGINSYHQSLSALAAKGLSGGIGIRLLLGPVPTPPLSLLFSLPPPLSLLFTPSKNNYRRA